jgi:hypothetical protein
VSLPRRTAAGASGENAPDSADAVFQAPAGLGHEAGGENGARIHDEDGVVIAELREKTAEGRVQGPAFL